MHIPAVKKNEANHEFTLKTLKQQNNKRKIDAPSVPRDVHNGPHGHQCGPQCYYKPNIQKI